MILPEDSKHFRNLEYNLFDVEDLLIIHSELSKKKDLKQHIGVLHKSAFVLLIACWEAFVEDLAKEAFEFMLDNSNSHEIFPRSVLTLASKSLKDDKDESKIWQIAGQGWKEVLKSHKRRILAKYIDNLNSPKPEVINKLFKELIGLNNITEHWHWKSYSSEHISESLNEYIFLRGSIVHQVQGMDEVTKYIVNDASDIIYRISIITHNKVTEHITSRTGKKPWDTVRYSKRKFKYAG